MNLDEALKIPYPILVHHLGHHLGLDRQNDYVAFFPDFGRAACQGFGETEAAALSALAQKKIELLAYYIDHGMPFPKPTRAGDSSFDPHSALQNNSASDESAQDTSDNCRTAWIKKQTNRLKHLKQKLALAERTRNKTQREIHKFQRSFYVFHKRLRVITLINKMNRAGCCTVDKFENLKSQTTERFQEFIQLAENAVRLYHSQEYEDLCRLVRKHEKQCRSLHKTISQIESILSEKNGHAN